MTYSRLILAGFLLFLLAVNEQALAQEGSSATSEQQQTLDNTQEIITGNQTITFPSSTPLRSFSMPGESPVNASLPIPSHFAPPVTDGNFGNLMRILRYKDTFTMEDAEALSQQRGKMRVLTTCYLPEDLRKPKPSLRIITEPKDRDKFNQEYEQIGIGNYKALDADSISEHVLGVSIQEGLRIGADIIIFQEGAALKQVGRGYSIGFFNSFSFSNNANQYSGLGNVAVGGLGFGKGETGYTSRPWLRVQFFKEISPTLTQRRNFNSGAEMPKNQKEINDYEDTLKKAKEATPEQKKFIIIKPITLPRD